MSTNQLIELATPPKPKAKIHPANPEQRAIIDQLTAFQTECALSDDNFARELGTCSGATWNKIKNDAYPAPIAKPLAEIREAAARFRTRRQAAQKRGVRTFFPDLPHVEALSLAIDEAEANSQLEEDEKLVWYIAPSRGGKTEIGRWLQKTRNAKMITARQSWGTSYFSAVTHICAELGIKPPPKSTTHQGEDTLQPGRWRGVSEPENALLDHLRDHPCILIMQEVEYFGRPVLNLLKSILNDTPCVVVILCLPEFFADIKRRGGVHAEQLQLRSIAPIELPKITPSIALRFLNESMPDINSAILKSVAAPIANAANIIGRFGLLRRVSRTLAEECAASGILPDAVLAETHIAKYRRFTSTN